MAAGDITAVVTDTHIDWNRNLVTYSVNTLIEDKNGNKYTLSSKTLTKQYQDQPTLTGMTLSAVVGDGTKQVTAPVALATAPAQVTQAPLG